MILINVLPPEFRKRDAGVSPIFLAGLGGILLNAAVIALAVWVHYVQIPAAETTLREKEDLLSQLKVRVKAIKDKENEIATAEKRRDTLFALLGKKVFMARPLHEFVTLLGSDGYTEPGFKVSIGKLDMEPQEAQARGRRGRTAPKENIQVVQWEWELKIVGENEKLTGNYLKSFFQRIANSEFWAKNGFKGDPAESYDGDDPKFNEDIQKVAVTCQLTWLRVVKPIIFKTKPSVTVATNATNAAEER